MLSETYVEESIAHIMLSETYVEESIAHIMLSETYVEESIAHIMLSETYVEESIANEDLKDDCWASCLTTRNDNPIANLKYPVMWVDNHDARIGNYSSEEQQITRDATEA
ncbi:unnamed protein product [Cyprideis torosa]|uniref:Uncharacterized protein n=1 Tax=Cyprideis torosa TaxID=163714 RepID=A0A7R8WK03_9CRUS|nr:unnamed protein product [Cyprideis torosa]CAG0902577.1 unnamed protein product [Cyprideis torosa]